jgi:hypothetical protein
MTKAYKGREQSIGLYSQTTVRVALLTVLLLSAQDAAASQSVSENAGPRKMESGAADSRNAQSPNTGRIQASGGAAVDPTPTRLATQKDFQTRSQERRSRARLYTVLDNSGSMRRSDRFHCGVHALERWVDALDSHSDVIIELLVATDHVVHQGTFELRDENNRGQILDRLRDLEAERTSRTFFRTIDDELATFIKQHTRAEERFGVVFVTDGRSDQPQNDWRLQELGDQVLSLGGGLYAAVSGSVPEQEALSGLASSQTKSPRREAARSRCRYRRLLAPSIAFESSAALRATLRQRFFGGFDPIWVSIGIENTSESAREVRLDARAPDGMTAQFIPAVARLAGNKEADLKVAIAATSDVSGSIVLTALTPDGSVVETKLVAEVTVESWLGSNWLIVSGVAVVGALLLGIFLTHRRRAWFIVPLGRPEHGLYIRHGDSVPLNMTDPAVPSGVWLKRRWGGLWLRTDGEPMRVAGIPVQHGRDIRYRLRTPIDVGDASVVLDRRSRRQASSCPPIIAGASERVTACDELL